jgi:hypothetical protein
MKYGLILVIIVFLGCRQGDNKTTDSKNALTDNESLIELLQGLPTIKTPLTFHSSEKIKWIEPKDDKLIKAILDKMPGFNAYGQLTKSKTIIATVGIVPADKATPVIYTFDLNGNKVDSIFTYHTAGESMGYYAKNIVCFTALDEFSITDSTLTLKLNKEGTNEIEGTDSLIVSTTKFKITDKGIIKVIE